MSAFDVDRIRKDFPVLQSRVHGKSLIYLDNAATAQKPMAVIEKMKEFYANRYATIHRGVYTLSQQATEEYEEVRAKCRIFLNAERDDEIVFVRGATEAINLVAAGYGRKFLREGDEMILSELEHHANIVPWQRLCEEKRLVLKVIPMNDRGELLLDEYEKLLSPKTRFVAFTHISNAIGTVNPVRKMTALARRAGAAILVDGAQGAVHEKVDVRALDCDFYCFSGHKIYGPTGVGVLYGKIKHLEAMDPYQFGGEMIESVSFEKTTFAKSPYKFEAGTPAIAEIIGLGAALDYLTTLGFDKIHAYEKELLCDATRKMTEVKGLTIVGQAAEKSGVVSFILKGVHPHDVGTILDQDGIAVRTGHHCAQPVMKHFRVPATARISPAFYNTKEEIDILLRALEKVSEVFR